MPLAYRTEENHPLVLALFHDTEVADGVNLDVDVGDEMFGFFHFGNGQDRAQALAMYFQSGLAIWTTLREVLAWRFGTPDRVGKLLDFASGYGRVTRFVVREVPPERVWVADLYAAGVRFQEETFGVHGVVSTVDPEDFPCAERFDAILVSSLFTHLPEAAFLGWLERLWGLLAPGGVLAFSVHDPALHWPPVEMPPSGILFEEVSESGSHDKAQYGSAWVTEELVRGALARIAPGASALRVPRGLTNYQDLWVVAGEPGADFSGLALRAELEGYMEHCSLHLPDRLELAGWVVDRITGAPVREVQAVIDGEVLQATSVFTEREDAARLYAAERARPQGWRLSVRLPPRTPRASAVLVVRGVDAAGRESVLSASTIELTLARSARLDAIVLREQIERMRAEHEAAMAEAKMRQQQAAWEIHLLEARVAAMEASRFWKLRNRWFALKRWLRLTDQP